MTLSHCNETAGEVVPRINRNRCEGKAECVRVCPYNVFAVRLLIETDRAGLSLTGKLKSWVHGGKQAYVVNPEACHACGLCVTSCPEKAITLQRSIT